MEHDYQTIYTAAAGRAVAGPWNWTLACARFHQRIAQSTSPKAIAASYINDGPIFANTSADKDACPEWSQHATHVVVRWKPHNRANYRHQDRVVRDLSHE